MPIPGKAATDSARRVLVCQGVEFMLSPSKGLTASRSNRPSAARTRYHPSLSSPRQNASTAHRASRRVRILAENFRGKRHAPSTVDGYSHELVALIALASLDTNERNILSARWAGLESGATLSDHFRVMWEIAEAGDSRRHLVHRCFVDSDDPKDHGCVTQALNYATGSIGFIEQYMAGQLDDAYPSEESFLENLGMFLGVASHHVADLCTPVHVGHKMDYRRVSVASAARFHRRVERDMGRLVRSATIALQRPQRISLSSEYFWQIAQTTYERHFLRLEDLYAEKDRKGLQELTSEVITTAVHHTASIWHTVLAETGMCKQKWSRDPLV